MVFLELAIIIGNLEIFNGFLFQGLKKGSGLQLNATAFFIFFPAVTRTSIKTVYCKYLMK